jgi:starch synthase (maltosyl-transferring)
MSELLTPATPSSTRKRVATPRVSAAEYTAPSILRAHNPAQIENAAALGFNFVLIANPDHGPHILRAGLAPLLDLSLDAPAPNAPILEEHPDWFVHGPHGPAFRYLADHDETVSWWDDQIAAYQESGFTGFYVRRAHAIPPAVLSVLITAAHTRNAKSIFIAEIFGATPVQIQSLAGIGCNFVTSSSCFWDFSAPWLNGDTARISAVAPILALATPPAAPALRAPALQRALKFSAAFAPAWLVDAASLAHDFLFTEEVRALNELRTQNPHLRAHSAAELRSSPAAPLALLARGRNFIIAINPLLDQEQTQKAAALLPTLGLGGLQAANQTITPADTLTLPAAAVEFFEAPTAPPVFLPIAPKLNCDAPRLAIERITPQVDDGKPPVRRTLGELVTIEADLIADGHDKLAAEILIRAADEKSFRAYPMRLINNDRWTGAVPLERLGRHAFAITAWKDSYATFTDELTKKHAAGISVSLELQEGMLLVEEAAAGDKKLFTMLEHLRALSGDALRTALLSENMAAIMRQKAPRKFLARSHNITLDAERPGASFASWYEIFPRSQSGDPNRHGNFHDVIAQLPRIAAMGFDVLYFPPIHPIGEKNRKGRNNTLKAGPDDPGSPYAIGSQHGGHDALHPELGSFEDFKTMLARAADFNIEIALDFAIQCAPDHPWLREHPDWFDWRPDGSLRYAENPPKKYEDIVNVDFYTDGAKPALWLALRDAVQFWINLGVKIFRVDNPHTKPFPFWEWLIADIHSRHPDAIFLAEAFTRPKIMYRLAKIGFSQSYTYFTWRNTKPELEEYLNELTTTAPKDFFRPHFFVNTPDINPPFLHASGRPGFLIRAALAATLSGLWGVYNGFELCDATAVPGKEEYYNSEKYEIKAWDHDRPGNIIAEITALNAIRKSNAALHSHLNVEFLPCDNPNVIYFRKYAPDGNVLLIAISLDPYNIQDTTIELPLWRFGLPDEGALQAEDLMRDHKFTWNGKFQHVRLNPSEQPFCIWRVSA